MKKLLLTCLACAMVSPAFAWVNTSYNNNLSPVTGAVVGSSVGRIRVTWEGYTTNYNWNPFWVVRLTNYSTGALVAEVPFSTLNYAFSYDYTFYVSANTLYNVTLYAKCAQPLNTNPPNRHTTNWCWIYY